jgi:hypothetical protein
MIVAEQKTLSEIKQLVGSAKECAGGWLRHLCHGLLCRWLA